MSTYHRNFEFRVPPSHGQRHGQYITPLANAQGTGTQILIGAPVIADYTQTADPSYGGLAGGTGDLQPVAVAAEASAPVQGASGIAVYEFKNAEAFAGFDPYLTTFADLAFIPYGAACMVIASRAVTVLFRNTATELFLNTRPYPARTMVSGMALATPIVTPGCYLTPGPGNDAAGYWEVTGNPALAWLRVTRVDNVRGEVEARFLFDG